jgi:hypothetical protein
MFHKLLWTKNGVDGLATHISKFVREIREGCQGKTTRQKLSKYTQIWVALANQLRSSYNKFRLDASKKKRKVITTRKKLDKCLVLIDDFLNTKVVSVEKNIITNTAGELIKKIEKDAPGVISERLVTFGKKINEKVKKSKDRLNEAYDERKKLSGLYVSDKKIQNILDIVCWEEIK